MIIGIDYRPALLSRAGIGRYTREITTALADHLADGDELRLFGASLARPDRLALEAGFAQRGPAVRLVSRRFPGRLLHFLGRLGLMGVETLTGPLDVFLYTDLVYPPLRRTACVVVIHDLAFLRSSSFHESGFGAKVWCRMQPVLRRARSIIVPSPATAEDLRGYAPFCAERVEVVPHGCDHLMRIRSQLTRSPPGIVPDGPYFLAVGTWEPRKNWERVLHAFEAAIPLLSTRRAGEVSREPEPLLVFAGTKGWLCSSFLDQVHLSPLRARIRLIDEVDDGELIRLYEGALALVYPSLWEGFGLPVAEALSLGCPVVTSKGSAMSWLATGAAQLVDPESVTEIAEAMAELAHDDGLRESLSRAGRERAGQANWARAGAATLQVLKRLTPGCDHAGENESGANRDDIGPNGSTCDRKES